MTVLFNDALGEPTSVSVVGTASSAQALTAVIPGENVRYPSFTYRIEAAQRQCGTFLSNCTDPEGPYGHTYTATTPSYTVNVDNHLRLSFVTSTGAAAAGVDVVWGPLLANDGPEKLWHTTADSSGVVDLVVPRNDPAVTAAAAAYGYMNIVVKAKTNKPTQQVPDNTIDVRQVEAATEVASVPLGSAYLAAKPLIQDSAIKLIPDTVSFSPPVGQAGTYATECYGGSAGFLGNYSHCKQTLASWHEWMRQADNVGADTGFTTVFTYSMSQSTTSTVLYRNGSSWLSSGGEVTTSRSTSASFNVTRTSGNYDVDIDWIWDKAKYTDCAIYSCAQNVIVSPLEWTGGQRATSQYGSHGQAAVQGGDCVIPIDSNYTVSREDSEQQTHLLSSSPDASLLYAQVFFHVHYVNTTSAATKTTYTWTGVPTVSEPFLHLFVPNAWYMVCQNYTCSNFTYVLHCPADTPDDTFTDRSNVSKGPYTPPHP